MHRFETFLSRGAGSLWTLVGAALLVALAVTRIARGEPMADLDVVRSLVGAAGLVCQFVGARADSRLVQRIGLGLFGVWLFLIVADWASCAVAVGSA